MKNGELLTRAASEFDAFITVDRQLPFQQDLSRFSLAVVVMRARSNRLSDLQALVPQLLAAAVSGVKSPGSAASNSTHERTRAAHCERLA